MAIIGYLVKRLTRLSIFIEAFQDQWILILLAALGLKIIFNFVGMILPAIGEANWYEAISLISPF